MSQIPSQVPEVPIPAQERFWSKLYRSETTSCWEFSRGRDECGYGIFSFDRDDFRAHRVCWRIVFGPIENGLHVLHKCDNPPCCNPFHLRLGTHSANMMDMATKRRGTEGEKSRMAKFTDKDILEIRKKYVPWKYPTTRIAQEYGVTPSTINFIVRNITWKHVV